MRRYFRRRKQLFALVVTVMLLSQAAILLNSVLRQKLVDAALAFQSEEITRYVLLMIGYGLVRGGLYTASSVLESYFNAGIGDDMRQAGFMGIIQRPVRIFLSVNDADYVSAITNDVRTIQSRYVQMSYMALLYGASMVTSVALLLYYQPVVAVAAVFCAVLTTFLPVHLGKYTQKYRKAYSQKQSDFTACMTELFSGFSVIHSFGVLSHATNQFNSESDALRKAEYRAEGMEAFADGIGQTLSITAQSLILAVACAMIFWGKMTAGALVAVVGLNSTVCSCLSLLLKLIPVIRGTRPVVERLNGFADEAAGEANGSVPFTCPSFHKKLEVRNLTFGYRPGESVLRNLSFSITPGEKCALIGPNGSGKTTLIRLLTGELEGYEGEILYDGAPLTDAGRDSVCAVGAVIHQEVFLFEDTIRNNICLWQEFSEEEFERAIRLSGVKDFAARFAEGMEYQVGQRGAFLSGGQRQRVAIARALIRNTPLLILDEGTSALDEATAAEIEDALLKIPELTLITITHHLTQRERYSQVIAL